MKRYWNKKCLIACKIQAAECQSFTAALIFINWAGKSRGSQKKSVNEQVWSVQSDHQILLEHLLQMLEPVFDETFYFCPILRLEYDQIRFEGYVSLQGEISGFLCRICNNAAVILTQVMC